MVTQLSFVLAFVFFALEWGVFGTAGPTAGLLTPLVISCAAAQFDPIHPCVAAGTALWMAAELARRSKKAQ